MRRLTQAEWAAKSPEDQARIHAEWEALTPEEKQWVNRKIRETQDEEWKQQPPTPGQLSFLKDLGYRGDPPPNRLLAHAYIFGCAMWGPPKRKRKKKVPE